MDFDVSAGSPSAFVIVAVHLVKAAIYSAAPRFVPHRK